ncbi:hypothetical protein NKR19_g2255 [Coniochaeta hoffmannii]|uniref:Uncharacterized protein n=1 Tax=Coniochaeta hoffmannii TaxID=91930 RepID=A0AA38RYB5_9PEZI|nr:hypothetical protein NKR19_g2255 [Coniochaeta hoffmannii]
MVNWDRAETKRITTFNSERSFQPSFEDEQIRLLVASQHLLNESAQMLADAHNTKLPYCPQVTAEQARSIVRHRSNDPRFRSQDNGAGAGLAVSASISGQMRYADHNIDDDDGNTSFGGLSVPGPANTCRQTMGGSGYLGPATNPGGSSSYYSAMAHMPGMAPTLPHGQGDQGFAPGAGAGQPFSPNAPTGHLSAPHPLAPGYQYQHQQSLGGGPMYEINGNWYHRGRHWGCDIEGTHRHTDNGEVVFPSTAAYEESVSTVSPVSDRLIPMLLWLVDRRPPIDNPVLRRRPGTLQIKRLVPRSTAIAPWLFDSVWNQLPTMVGVVLPARSQEEEDRIDMKELVRPRSGGCLSLLP